MMVRAVAVVGLCTALTGCVIYLDPQCNDQIHNGDETGIDCGGSCGKCEVGAGCRIDGDCDEANCVAGVCTAFACDNGVQDLQETDIDCGGACRACAGGRTCRADADCASGRCNPATMTCSALSVSFGPEVRYASGHKPYVVLGADLDGDGRTDLAAINEYGNSIAVFHNAFGASGSFTHVDIPKIPGDPLVDPSPRDDPGTLNFGPTGDFPTGGDIADFNHDGSPDLVTADFHGNSVTILLNDGSGKLIRPPPASCPMPQQAPPCSYPTLDKAETQNVAVGDLDHDHNPDVVATNPQRASVSVFLGRGDGTLAPAINLPVGVAGGSQPYAVVIADLDGDGNNDLAISDDRSRTIIVRLGRGDAAFGPEVPYEIQGGQSYFLVAHDMNGDGKLDLVTANRTSDDVSVLLGRGDGTFRKAIVSKVGPPGPKPPTGPFGPYALAVADVNQDGVPDIVTPNYLSNSVSILLGIGNGHFDPAIELQLAGPAGPYGVFAGDFDGDGKPDLVTSNNVSEDLAVWLSTGRQH